MQKKHYFFIMLASLALFLISPTLSKADPLYNISDISQRPFQSKIKLNPQNFDPCSHNSRDYYWSAPLESCLRTEEGSIVWHGFRHIWQNTSHRLSRLGSYFRNIEYDDFSDEPGGDLVAEHRSIFRVGEYNDKGDVRIKGRFIKSGVLGIHHGHVDENCLTVSGRMGSQESVSCFESIDLAEIGFEDYDQVTVVMRGFRLRATSYNRGYNTRGFEMRVIPAEISDGIFRFEARFSIHPEHSPDRPMASSSILGDDCGDCNTYTYTGRIYYTLMGVKSHEGKFTNAADSGTNSYSQSISMHPGKTPALADSSERQAAIQGDVGFDQGTIAIQGFKWHLGNWNSTQKDGRYIRELRMNLANVAYNPETGRANFKTNMYFSNKSAIPYGYNVSFKMWNALIQTNDNQLARSNRSWFNGNIAKGETSFTRELLREF